MHTPPLIFVVDDDRKFLRRVVALIESAGYQCRAFEDPMDLLREVQETTPDLIVTDNEMFPIDGIALIRRLIEMGFTGPIIMMSLDRSIGASALAKGARAFVSKAQFDYVLLKNMEECLPV